eukprot:CAMPEP_0202968248 /NCGR_PEP_ID=MMETSP1396-20130829/13498_1 /ASSEMBLY_ACC=CAM_ASM_000872 /TAXON_ID= /ORGANISM="Pseudokeronopsis sp., Strain Brazil" /LENGTH=134 /DNA_ID=CAMNT_0049694375 /DNA_START=27 /DNA_END=431 /DNA_ORIENTATION=-
MQEFAPFLDLKYQGVVEQVYNIDITQMSDVHNGLECVKLVKEFLAENELIEPLILVLKHLLKSSNFNDPYSGGLSSYALFLLIIAFLQTQDQQQKRLPREQVNLGKTLMDFLSLYSNFDQNNYGIAVSLPGRPA